MAVCEVGSPSDVGPSKRYLGYFVTAIETKKARRKTKTILEKDAAYLERDKKTKQVLFIIAQWVRVTHTPERQLRLCLLMGVPLFFL